jgi:hypothetical protein
VEGFLYFGRHEDPIVVDIVGSEQVMENFDVRGIDQLLGGVHSGPVGFSGDRIGHLPPKLRIPDALQLGMLPTVARFLFPPCCSGKKHDVYHPALTLSHTDGG